MKLAEFLGQKLLSDSRLKVAVWLNMLMIGSNENK